MRKNLEENTLLVPYTFRSKEPQKGLIGHFPVYEWLLKYLHKVLIEIVLDYWLSPDEKITTVPIYPFEQIRDQGLNMFTDEEDNPLFPVLADEVYDEKSVTGLFLEVMHYKINNRVTLSQSLEEILPSMLFELGFYRVLNTIVLGYLKVGYWEHRLGMHSRENASICRKHFFHWKNDIQSRRATQELIDEFDSLKSWSFSVKGKYIFPGSKKMHTIINEIGGFFGTYCTMEYEGTKNLLNHAICKHMPVVLKHIREGRGFDESCTDEFQNLFNCWTFKHAFEYLLIVLTRTFFSTGRSPSQGDLFDMTFYGHILSHTDSLNAEYLKQVSSIFHKARALIESAYFLKKGNSSSLTVVYHMTSEMMASMCVHIEQNLKLGHTIKTPDAKRLDNSGNTPTLLNCALKVLGEEVEAIEFNSHPFLKRPGFLITPGLRRTGIRLYNYHYRSDSLKSLYSFIHREEETTSWGTNFFATNYSQKAKDLAQKILDTPVTDVEEQLLLDDINTSLTDMDAPESYKKVLTAVLKELKNKPTGTSKSNSK